MIDDDELYISLLKDLGIDVMIDGIGNINTKVDKLYFLIKLMESTHRELSLDGDIISRLKSMLREEKIKLLIND